MPPLNRILNSPHTLGLGVLRRPLYHQFARARPTTTARPLNTQARPSRHAQFYTDYAAGMVPVALLGSAVYIGLRTWQQHLAHEMFLEEEHAHVQELQAEVIALKQQQQSPIIPVQDVTIAAKRRGWWPW